MSVTILPGDCLDTLQALPDNSVDSCVTDPPYHFASIVKRFGAEGAAPAKSNGATGVYVRASTGFMGKQWDGGDIAFRESTWAAVLRVLKPGAHLVAFGAPKNYHQLASAVEAAGFEIRDSLLWLFGTGFPKSHNIGDGWGTALKPGYEPIVLARKPLSESTVAANVLRWGTGALNIDACRIEYASAADMEQARVPQPIQHNDARGVYQAGTGIGRNGEMFDPSKGRWPANVVHDGSDEVVGAFPHSKSGALTAAHQVNGGFAGTVHCYGTAKTGGINEYAANEGSAARFFYSAKASKADRAGSKHPTVKPVALMAWLCRLITPKGGTILDPFAGSGTTGQAALQEGFKAILCEREPEYLADIERRLARREPVQISLLNGDAA